MIETQELITRLPSPQQSLYRACQELSDPNLYHCTARCVMHQVADALGRQPGEMIETFLSNKFGVPSTTIAKIFGATASARNHKEAMDMIRFYLGV